MKNRFLWITLALFLLAGIFGLSSCSDIITASSSSKNASLSLKFTLNSTSAVRAATLPEAKTSKDYRILAAVTGDFEQSQEKTAKSGEEVSISFTNIPLDSEIKPTVKVQLRIYDDDGLVWAGTSEEVTLSEGENTVSVVLREILKLYVSETGSDENTGSSAKSPLKTLSAAIAKIPEYTEEYALENIDWVISVSGTVYGSSKISAEIKAASITIQSLDEDKAVLDGQKDSAKTLTGPVLEIGTGIDFDVTLSNLTIQNGRARMGGGIDSCGTGTLTLQNCIVQNNEAVTVVDPTINGNSNGGGIRVTYGKLKLIGTTVYENHAEYNAGGIFVNNGATLEIDENTLITKNTSDYTAGGLCIGIDSYFEMSGGKITENSITGVDVTKFDGTVITGGKGNGAGVRVTGGSETVKGGVFIMTGGEISGNEAKGDNAGGGGVDVTNGTFTMKGGTITKNKASRRGGGIGMNGTYGTSVTIEGGEISYNEAVGVLITDKENSSFGTYGAFGGAIALNLGTLTISGGKIIGNTSRHNAGAINQDNGTFVMTGGEITGNTAKSNAGGVYLNRSTFTMKGGKISGNIAESYEYENAEGVTKSSGGNGGGMHINRGHFVFEGGEISENTASKTGGGIYLAGKVDEGDVGAVLVELKGGVVNGNNARNGGGIYISNENATLEMSSGKVTGNDATKNGGGIYNNRGSLVLSGKITISENSANKAKQVYVANSVALATLEYTYEDEKTGAEQTELLYFLYGTDENGNSYGESRLDVNLVDGVFENLESEETIRLLDNAFRGSESEDETGYNDGESQSASTGSASSSDYTIDTYTAAFPNRGLETWNEDEFISALQNALDGSTVTLQGTVILTKDFSTDEFVSEKSITIDCQDKYGIRIQAPSVKFKNITFQKGAGTYSFQKGDGITYYRPFGIIYWESSGSEEYEDCTFSGGVTTGDIGGGALALFGQDNEGTNSTTSLKNCIFVGNSSTHGGAIDIASFDTLTLINCVFSKNTNETNPESSTGSDINLGGSASRIEGYGNMSDCSNPYAGDSSKLPENLFITAS